MKFFEKIVEWLKSLFKKPEVVIEPPKVDLEAQYRKELVDFVRKDLGQRETHGKNRSPLIDKINTSVNGASIGAPYCMSGLVFRGLLELCKLHDWKFLPWMNTASTQTFFSKAPEKYKILKGFSPKMGDICIQQQYADSGKGHAYMLTEDEAGDEQKTIEYNTDGSGGRDGDGVYERTRTQAGDKSKRYLGAVNVIQALMDYNEVTTDQPAIPASKTFKADWDHLSTGKEWTKILVDAIQNHGKGMLAVPNVKDAADWAPGFAKMTQDQRMQFFVALFSSMARFESGFKPATTYTEGFNDAKGEPVVSRGLLQLSIESVNQKAYGGDVARAEYLHDVKVNLVCGVKILNHWVVNDGVIATAKLGGAQYWSVLRDTSNKKKLIQAKVAELCK